MHLRCMDKFYAFDLTVWSTCHSIKSKETKLTIDCLPHEQNFLLDYWTPHFHFQYFGLKKPQTNRKCLRCKIRIFASKLALGRSRVLLAQIWEDLDRGPHQPTSDLWWQKSGHTFCPRAHLKPNVSKGKDDPFWNSPGACLSFRASSQSNTYCFYHHLTSDYYLD